MNKFSLEKLFKSLRAIKLSSSEKSFMRLRIAQHMRHHPIGSRPSIFAVRYMAPVALALVLFVGTGGLVAFASQGTLPGETLYPIKRATEQVKKVALRDSKSKADYELALIDKRFSETNQLIAQQKLTVQTEAVLTDAIQEHTNDFKNDVAKLAENDPAGALSYNTKLGSTLKTGTHILLALSDKQPLRDSKVTPNTLVLAAYATAEKVSIEKKQLETIVLSDTSIATIKTAEKRYADTLAMLNTQKITPTAPDMGIMATTEGVTTATLAVDTQKLKTLDAKTVEPVISEKTDSAATVVVDTKPEDLQTLADSLRAAYEAKKYRQVITIADQIDQIIHEAKKIKEAEETFKVNLSDDTTPIIETETPDTLTGTEDTSAKSR